MRLDLATELPLDWLHWISVDVVLLEESNSTVGVATSEVLPIVGDNKLSDWVLGWSISCLKWSVKLLELPSLRVHQLNVTVILGTENLSAIRCELDSSEVLEVLSL